MTPAPLRGSAPIAFAVCSLGIASYSAMDAVTKGMTIAMGVYVAMQWRFAAILAITGAIHFARRPAPPGRVAMRVHVVRAMVTVVMALLFFWGLARVPMAQAIALTYVAPLLSLGLAAVLLKERVTRAVVGASLVAAVGVGVILYGHGKAQLGDDAFAGAIAIFASAICYSYNIILMRQQARVADPAEISFYQSLLVSLFLLPAVPWLFALPPLAQVGPILLSAVLATVSLFLLSWGYARAEANYLAPTEFTSFLWAALLGWMVFGESVSPFTIAGAVLIVAGCIIAARRRDGAVAPETEAVLP